MAQHGTVLDEYSRRALQRLARETGEEDPTTEQQQPGDTGGGGGNERDVMGATATNTSASHTTTIPPQPVTTTATTWSGYAMNVAWRTATGVLSVLDAAGEWLAATLGITTPKYQYIIDDVVAMQREADEEERMLQEQMAEANAERDAAVARMEAVPEAAAASLESIA